MPKQRKPPQPMKTSQLISRLQEISNAIPFDADVVTGDDWMPASLVRVEHDPPDTFLVFEEPDKTKKPLPDAEVAQLAASFEKQATEFLEASRRCTDAQVVNGRFASASVPQVVCAAFAVELGLKSLLIIENQTKPYGHKLARLFDDLSTDSKSHVQNAVSVPTYPKMIPPQTFESALKAVSTAFVDWRYCCEGLRDLVADVGFLTSLASNVIERSRSMQKSKATNTEN